MVNFIIYFIIIKSNSLNLLPRFYSGTHTVDPWELENYVRTCFKICFILKVKLNKVNEKNRI